MRDPYALVSLAEIIARRQEEQRLTVDTSIGDSSWSEFRRTMPRAPKPVTESRTERTERLTRAVIEGLRAGKTRTELAAQLHIKRCTISRMTARWQQRGGAVPETAAKGQSKVLVAVANGAQTIPEVSRALGISDHAARASLKRLVDLGKIWRLARGVYALPADGRAA